MSEIPQELQPRVLALVQSAADMDAWCHTIVSAEARDIMAHPDFPKPVDPDIQIARDLIADSCALQGGDPDYIRYWREGHYDDAREFSVVLAALKRGAGK
jgi:hypothetical protein